MTDDWAKHDPPPDGDERPPEKVKPRSDAMRMSCQHRIRAYNPDGTIWAEFHVPHDCSIEVAGRTVHTGGLRGKFVGADE